jgi:hypothetical protein
MHMRMFLSTAAVALMSVTSLAQLRGPENFTAVGVPASTVVSDAGTVLMSLDRWSTAAERSMLERALREKGTSAVLDTLRNMRPLGTIRTPDSPRYELRYAYQTRVDNGGRRIVLATDRPTEFWEACQRPRLVGDSSFTVIEMHIGPEGRGTGTLSIATKIRAYDDLSIALEDVASCRVMLTDILAVPDDERE